MVFMSRTEDIEKKIPDSPDEKSLGYSAFDIEKEVSFFWEKEKIFNQSLERFSPKGDYSFYDGPPFATGTPHYGHIVASTIKDVIPRYKTMNGYRVERKWGWDCHGLPIENIAEKELGIKRKKDIEKMGVAVFNELCRSKVLSYVESWKSVIKKLGRWVDMENCYNTMDLNYMESVWWVFKELWKKELIYESYRSMHICPRCETTLSQTEVSEGYKDVKDLSVIAKFKIDPNQKIGNFVADNDTYALAWTTTPWTLIGNVALAVNENIEYVVVNMDDQSTSTHGKFIFAKDRLVEIEKNFEKKNQNEPIKALAVVIGKEMIGIKYQPVFNYYDNAELKNREKAWKIYGADFVTVESGTGIVHIAPAFGEDDMSLGKKYGLPFIQHVGMDGTIKEVAKEFAGMNVKPIDDTQKTDVEIIKYLSRVGLLYHKEKFEHSYPHCWRCETPLINYATSSWFVSVEKVKKEALQYAENINWFPAHIKEGRFGKWLAEARDWSISRQRFWASVIPIWKCKCGEIVVFGSVLELENASGKKITDIHKHIVDEITVPCAKCNEEMHRVPDVLDTWFDSGSMPYAQLHYPFENTERFENNFPTEFIGEGIDQTRCWFYYLHVIATAIKNTNAFKNVIVNGIVLAEDGKKMSKKLKNYPDPSLVMDKYGADALRLYLVSSPIVAGENLNFSEEGVKNASRKIVQTFWNVFQFFELFNKNTKIVDFPSDLKLALEKSSNLLDKWILIKLNKLIAETTQGMEGYNLPMASRPIAEFINDLSTWYLRRSRDRFKSDDENDKNDALRTTFFVLNQLSKIMAPFAPFISEFVWQSLNGKEFTASSASVHLEAWPESFVLNNDEIDILNKMDSSKKIVEICLAARSSSGIKVRQVLNKITIKSPTISLLNFNDDYINLIKEEVNIKNIEFIKQDGDLVVDLDTVITPELELEGLVREIIRAVNSLRKDAGFSINDSIDLCYSNRGKILDTINNFRGDILKKTLSVNLIEKDISDLKFKKEILFNDDKLIIGITAHL